MKTLCDTHWTIEQSMKLEAVPNVGKKNISCLSLLDKEHVYCLFFFYAG